MLRFFSKNDTSLDALTFTVVKINCYDKSLFDNISRFQNINILFRARKFFYNYCIFICLKQIILEIYIEILKFIMR